MSDADPVIRFEDVSKCSTSGRTRRFVAVDKLSFEIAKGEIVAVLGKTGCGKSTIFNIVAGLIEPTSGKVRVIGHDPFREFDFFRGKIGIVFQNDRLMPWRTALDNVRLGLEMLDTDAGAREDTARAWLKRLGLAGHENDYPHALSGGMRQRVSIARAFAADPEILLCDEPFSALDEMTARDLRDRIRAAGAAEQQDRRVHHPSINEAMEIGDRVMVFHRPARIAYEAKLSPAMTEEALRSVNEDIMRVLAVEYPPQA